MDRRPKYKGGKKQGRRKGTDANEKDCGQGRDAGTMGRRACVVCGAQAVLYPIADALHLVHGPMGCTACTREIRGGLSPGPELHRMGFSTDLTGTDIINGGEEKLYNALVELIDLYSPGAAFVYPTCIVGIIGDDVDVVCRKVAAKVNIPVLPVYSGGGKDAGMAGCKALFQLIGQNRGKEVERESINILGEFNMGGEAWIIREYYRKIGIQVVSVMTGEGGVAEIQAAHKASLNVVLCSGAMLYLAQKMEQAYGIPYIRVSCFGLDDMSDALYNVAGFFSHNHSIMKRTESLVRNEVRAILPALMDMKKDLKGKKAGICVGDTSRTVSMIKALGFLGMDVVFVGIQSGRSADYGILKKSCAKGTVILDDAKPLALAKYIVETEAELFVGGGKERAVAGKMGIGFCDFNHDRKTPLAGFIGMKNFASEVHKAVTSPVWELVPGKNHDRHT